MTAPEITELRDTLLTTDSIDVVELSRDQLLALAEDLFQLRAMSATTASVSMRCCDN